MDIDQLIDKLNAEINLPILNEAQERILISALVYLLLSLLAKQK
jgi:hypothetical protein